jgi:hypothetical protein
VEGTGILQVLWCLKTPETYTTLDVTESRIPVQKHLSIDWRGKLRPMRDIEWGLPQYFFLCIYQSQ